MSELLHEEGIARCFREDEVAKLGGHVTFGEDGLDEFGARRQGELIHPDVCVGGSARPAVGILRPVEEDEEDRCIRKPADEVVEELLRGRVDPVEILDHEDKRLPLALPDEEITQGLEDLLPLLLGFEGAVGLITSGEREEVVEGGRVVFSFSSS